MTCCNSWIVTYLILGEQFFAETWQFKQLTSPIDCPQAFLPSLALLGFGGGFFGDLAQ